MFPLFRLSSLLAVLIFHSMGPELQLKKCQNRFFLTQTTKGDLHGSLVVDGPSTSVASIPRCKFLKIFFCSYAYCCAYCVLAGNQDTTWMWKRGYIKFSLGWGTGQTGFALDKERILPSAGRSVKETVRGLVLHCSRMWFFVRIHDRKSAVVKKTLCLPFQSKFGIFFVIGFLVLHFMYNKFCTTQLP